RPKFRERAPETGDTQCLTISGRRLFRCNLKTLVYPLCRRVMLDADDRRRDAWRRTDRRTLEPVGEAIAQLREWLCRCGYEERPARIRMQHQLVTRRPKVLLDVSLKQCRPPTRIVASERLQKQSCCLPH